MNIGLAQTLLGRSFLFCVFLALSSTSFAAGGDSRAWVGGGFGLSVPNAANSSARSILAINGGAKLGSEFGFGAYYRSSNKDESVSGVSVPLNYELYGVTAGYHFEGEAEGAYVGAMLGMSRVGRRYNGTDYSTAPMHWGVVAGFDRPFIESLSLGGELSFVSINGASATVSSTTQQTDAFSTLNFIAVAKLWF